MSGPLAHMVSAMDSHTVEKWSGPCSSAWSLVYTSHLARKVPKYHECLEEVGVALGSTGGLAGWVGWVLHSPPHCLPPAPLPGVLVRLSVSVGRCLYQVRPPLGPPVHLKNPPGKVLRKAELDEQYFEITGAVQSPRCCHQSIFVNKIKPLRDTKTTTGSCYCFLRCFSGLTSSNFQILRAFNCLSKKLITDQGLGSLTGLFWSLGFAKAQCPHL